MVKTFVPNLITLFQNNVYSESATDRGGNFLIGVGNKLFEVQNDYSVLEPASGFTAVGCGEVAAIGSLITTTTYYSDTNPIDHVKFALEAAEKACCGVQRPFVIINTKKPDEVINIE